MWISVASVSVSDRQSVYYKLIKLNLWMQYICRKQQTENSRRFTILLCLFLRSNQANYKTDCEREIIFINLLTSIHYNVHKANRLFRHNIIINLQEVIWHKIVLDDGHSISVPIVEDVNSVCLLSWGKILPMVKHRLSVMQNFLVPYHFMSNN